MFQKRSEIDNFIQASFNGITNCLHMEKNKLFCIQFFFLFVCRWRLKNERFIERYLLERIKTSVGHLQFMVRQKHNLVGHLILPRVCPIGRNVGCVFRLVGQILIWRDMVRCRTIILRPAIYITYIIQGKKQPTS